MARVEAGEGATLTTLVKLGLLDAAKAEPVLHPLGRLAATPGKLGGR